MRKFAKLIETEEMGQMLFMTTPNNDDGKEETTLMFDPDNNEMETICIRVTSTTPGFADMMLETMTDNKIIDMATKAKKDLNDYHKKENKNGKSNKRCN